MPGRDADRAGDHALQGRAAPAAGWRRTPRRCRARAAPWTPRRTFRRPGAERSLPHQAAGVVGRHRGEHDACRAVARAQPASEGNDGEQRQERAREHEHRRRRVGKDHGDGAQGVSLAARAQARRVLARRGSRERRVTARPARAPAAARHGGESAPGGLRLPSFAERRAAAPLLRAACAPRRRRSASASSRGRDHQHARRSHSRRTRAAAAGLDQRAEQQRRRRSRRRRCRPHRRSRSTARASPAGTLRSR